MLLQIQSVIYGNQVEALLKAMRALKQAVKVCKRSLDNLNVRLIYGDGTPIPVFDEEKVKEIQKMLLPEISFEYLFFGFNSGTAKGHNLMASDAVSDIMMIMNPDVIVEASCLKKLLTALNAQRVGMVEARQTPLEHAKEYDKVTGETDWASTACTMFKTAIYKQVEGFDQDSFFLYCDDLDFSWKVRLAGYKVIYVPEAIAYHAKTLSVEGMWQPTSAEIYYSAEAAMLLAYKWSNPERANYLCEMYLSKGGESEKKAAHEFMKRKETGRLPEMLDPEHKIAKFIGDEYCEMRFKFVK